MSVCLFVDAIYKYGQLIPPKSLADIIEALIGIYYIDCGVIGGLRFLHHCGILRPQIFSICRELDPMRVILGESLGQSGEQIEKLKRRKLTPMNSIILRDSEVSAVATADGNECNNLRVNLSQLQSIQVPHSQKIDNVHPHAPTFSAFPFTALEAALGHTFRQRELLFMACTHCSLEPKLNNERLEWIGDAAIDWIVCRHYWYNFRVGGKVTELEECTEAELATDYSTSLDHPTTAHIPSGHLPLSPESLTNARQSAINNESFACLVVKHNLQRFLRIDSPHLQIEIERFAGETCRLDRYSPGAQDSQAGSTSTLVPESLSKFHTPVSLAAPKVLGDLFEALMGAVLLDTNFDIDHFARVFDRFLRDICADPADLPTNAIQETLHLYARLGIPRHQIVFTYREISSGAAHDDRCLGVICQVWVKERCVAEAEGSNKQVAKKLAMEKALRDLRSV